MRTSTLGTASDAFGLLLAGTLVACLYTGCAQEAGKTPAEPEPVEIVEVRGAAIDGSEDELPVLPTDEELKSVELPDFEAIDEVNPGLRPTTIENVIDLVEDKEIREVERDGKPFKSVNWGLLSSYKYRSPKRNELNRDAEVLPKVYQNQIPEQIAALTEEQIAVQGFMIPLELERGRIKSFVLVRNQMFCCFDEVPDMNEWIHVKVLDGAGVPFMQDRPLTVYGRFEVGEIVKNGQLISIYRMDALGVDAGA